MIIDIHRIGEGPDSTLSYMFIDNKLVCFVLEDEYREVKVKGETRIPAGKYEVKFREEPSPMTTRYRQKYDWFQWHLELQGVPNFKYVYIHVGNTDDHTDGCLLVGYIAEVINGNYVIGNSRNAYRDLYSKIKLALKTEKVFVRLS